MLVLPLGIEENHTDFLGVEGYFFLGSGTNPDLEAPRGDFPSGSGQPQQIWRDCISFVSTVEGWLLSREGHGRPGYMASGLGGSLKSLAADMSFLMCLSSVMPAS